MLELDRGYQLYLHYIPHILVFGIYFEKLRVWNSVGLQVRRSLRAFPHPHFDKQIPDQQEPQPRGSKNSNRSAILLFVRLLSTFRAVTMSYDRVYKMLLCICQCSGAVHFDTAPALGSHDVGSGFSSSSVLQHIIF